MNPSLAKVDLSSTKPIRSLGRARVSMVWSRYSVEGLRIRCSSFLPHL
jgi:hypothetical protein